MTLTHTQERVPAAERIAVRCVDSDVHPTPKRGELAQYIPEPWRSKYFLARNVGEQIYYDAPDYAHAYAMRAGHLPAERRIPRQRPGHGVQAADHGGRLGHRASWSPPRTRRACPEAQHAMSARLERLAGQPLAGQPQQLARALARFDLRRHRGPGRRPCARSSSGPGTRTWRRS